MHSLLCYLINCHSIWGRITKLLSSTCPGLPTWWWQTSMRLINCAKSNSKSSMIPNTMMRGRGKLLTSKPDIMWYLEIKKEWLQKIINSLPSNRLATSNIWIGLDINYKTTSEWKPKDYTPRVIDIMKLNQE